MSTDLFLINIERRIYSSVYSNSDYCYQCGDSVPEIAMEAKVMFGHGELREFLTKFIIDEHNENANASITSIVMNGYPILSGLDDYDNLLGYLRDGYETYPYNTNEDGTPALPTKRYKHYGLRLYGPFYEKGLHGEFNINLANFQHHLSVVREKIEKLKEEALQKKLQAERDEKSRKRQEQREKREERNKQEKEQLEKLIKKHPKVAEEIVRKKTDV